MQKFTLNVEIQEGEHWWGGAVTHALKMPITKESEYAIDLTANVTENQSAPFFVSDQGRYIWCNRGFKLCVKAGKIEVESEEEILLKEGYETLRGAFLAAAKAHFPADGKTPAPIMFTYPRYCTWIALIYDQNEKDILAYAQSIIDAGLPAGELIIDDCWQEAYGTWTFHEGRFPDPKGMVKKLHDMGFKVSLWLSPFVTADTVTYRALVKKGVLLKDANEKIAVREWWNGYSALLDLTNPEAVEWLEGCMNVLMNEYGVDGFKFDAGSADNFREDDCFFDKNAIPDTQTEIWISIASKYELCQARVGSKQAGKGLCQSLCDKSHAWGRMGLQEIVPGALQLGLIGYAYLVADMVGGGQYVNFLPGSVFDDELFARYCECEALLPMVQYSYPLWTRTEELARIASKYTKLHIQFGDYILALAKHASVSGEPIIRMLEYEFPHSGLANVSDQFMLGDKYLVAPVLEKGATSRKVVLPSGHKWKRLPDGQTYEGGREIEVYAPVGELPYFEKID